MSSNRSNGPQLLEPVPADELVGVVDPVTGEVARRRRVSDPGMPRPPTGTPPRCGSSTPRWDRRGPRRPGPTASRPAPSCSVTVPAGQRWTLDVLATRDAAVAAGWAVVLVDQPWRVAGKKLGPAPASLDLAWLPVLEALAAGARRRPARGGRAQRRRPGGLPHRSGRGGSARCSPCPSRCTRPAGPRARARTSSRCRRRTASPCTWCRAAPTRSAPRPRSEAVLPPGATLDVVTGAHSIGGSARAVAALVVQRLARRLSTGARQRGNAVAGGGVDRPVRAAPGKVTPSCSSSTPQPPAGPG